MATPLPSTAFHETLSELLPGTTVAVGVSGLPGCHQTSFDQGLSPLELVARISK